MLRGALTVAVILAGVLAFACSSGDDGEGSGTGGPQAEDLSRSASAGGIDVQATWLTTDDDIGEDLAAYPLDSYLLLEVKLDTHSGDLGSIDMLGSSKLDTGSGTLEPEVWVATSDDAHHRSGVLVFQRSEVSAPVTLTLVLNDSGVAEVVWEEIPAG